jgi:hypothetical protein
VLWLIGKIIDGSNPQEPVGQRGVECVLEYDYHDVAQSQLGGWMASVRLWF